MNTNRLFQYSLVLFLCWLPFLSFADRTKNISIVLTIPIHQEKKGKKDDRRNDNKKPEVKEVPQSRRQEKPGEVKSDQKQKSNQENKKKNR